MRWIVKRTRGDHKNRSRQYIEVQKWLTLYKHIYIYVALIIITSLLSTAVDRIMSLSFPLLFLSTLSKSTSFYSIASMTTFPPVNPLIPKFRTRQKYLSLSLVLDRPPPPFSRHAFSAPSYSFLFERGFQLAGSNSSYSLVRSFREAPYTGRSIYTSLDDLAYSYCITASQYILAEQPVLYVPRQ